MDADSQRKLYQWDTYLSRINENKELTEKQKQEAISGINYIKSILGDDWLKGAVEKSHPLAVHMQINTPDYYGQVADFGKKLLEIKDVRNFDALRSRLMEDETYLAAEAEFEVAAYLKQAGLEVEIINRKKGKHADMLGKFKDAEVFFEVTELYQSHDWWESLKTAGDLNRPFLFRSDIGVDGVIHKVLSPPRIRELQLEIQEAIDSAKLKNEVVRLQKDGLIDYIIWPRGKLEERNMLLKEMGHPHGGIKHPDIKLDEVRRIKRTIFEESKQIPSDKPGVIVIYNYNFWPNESELYSKLISEVEEGIYEHQDLLGVVLVLPIFKGDDSGLIEHNKTVGDGSFFVRKPYALSWPGCYLVIKNRYSKFDTGMLDIFR